MSTKLRSAISKRRRSVSSLVATIFLILIIFAAFSVITVMFRSFVSYVNTADEAGHQSVANHEISLSSSFQFGSPVVPMGGSNPEPYNLNSIGSATVATPTSYSFERKLVYSQGFWWAFFASGSELVYESSSDGITWSPPAQVGTLTTTFGYGFSVWLGSNSTLYFALAGYDTANTFVIGDVILGPTGTIGSVTDSTININGAYDAAGYISITNDTSGNIWVALSIEHTTNRDRYVLVDRCTTAFVCVETDGAFPPSIHLARTSNHDLVVEVLAMSSGSMAVLYADSGSNRQGTFAASAFNIQTCDGGAGGGGCQTASGAVAWSGSVTTDSTFFPEDASALAIGTTVYFAGSTATGIGAWEFPIGGGTPTTYIIDSAVSGNTAPVTISENGTGDVLGSGNDLVVFYGSGTDLYLSTSSNDSSWSTAQTITTSETGVSGITSLVNSTQIGAMWTSGTSSPWTVRFAEANAQPYNPRQITPSTVAISTTSTATSSSDQTKLFFDQGLWWDFYTDGTSLSYATSADGLSWSTPAVIETIAGSAMGSDISFALKGNTIYFAISSDDNAPSFMTNTATLFPSGSLTLGNVVTVPTSFTSLGPVSIGVDVSGDVWVALTTLQGTSTYHIEVYEHPSGLAYSAGWSSNIAPISLPTLTATANSIIVASDADSGAALIAETSGTTGTGQISIYSTTVTSSFDSSAWTSPVSPASDYALIDSSSTIVGSTVCFAGLASSLPSQTTGTLDFWTYSMGFASTSNEEIIENAAGAWEAALGSYGETLFLFDSNVSIINYYYTSNLGYSWSPSASATTYEPNVSGLSAAGAGTFAVTWTSGNVAPYSVRFASLSSLTVTNNSPTAVHVVDLFISNPAENSLITYYSMNSTDLFDYWLAAGTGTSLAISFPWSVSTSYTVTFGTSTGIVKSAVFTSPS